MVCYNFGWNAGGELGFESRLNLQEATWHAREVSRVVKRYRPATMFLLEGGPIEDPAQLAVIYQEAEIDGYVGGSTIDRLPLEISVKNRTSHFKSAALMAHKMASEHETLVHRARAIGFMGTSPTILKVVKSIYRFRPQHGIGAHFRRTGHRPAHDGGCDSAPARRCQNGDAGRHHDDPRTAGQHLVWASVGRTPTRGCWAIRKSICW
jgi:hypothetical protein